MLTLERPTKISPSDADRTTARRLAQAIRSAPTLGEVGSELADAPIPEYIRAILTSVLERAGTEDNFYFLDENKELSPNIAAKIIGCSRPLRDPFDRKAKNYPPTKSVATTVSG